MAPKLTVNDLTMLTHLRLRVMRLAYALQSLQYQETLTKTFRRPEVYHSKSQHVKEQRQKAKRPAVRSQTPTVNHLHPGTTLRR